MSQFVVGLTGGIASGKSTVAECFAQLGITIVDADIIAREVVAPGTSGLQNIVKYFGSKILNTDGQLDRAQLRQHIFANDDHKQWLNNLLHPQIRQRMQQQCQQAQSEYVLLVVPLLVENNLFDLTQHLLVVDIDEQTQIQRTMTRDGVSSEHVQQILASQASREQRLSVADDIIVNDQSPENLQHQVNKLHQKFLDLAKKHAKA
ncbi:dephospho-CoA kinase [Alteromonadaceae bacterium BrNp21-10]|nr:dephospho-CoA kinase [Alteromonadaceae bacterium BrNp21-10]